MLNFLYTDDHIFALYKPPGLHTVQAGEVGGASIADLLLAWRPELSDSARTEGDAGLVHRLDRATSGVLLGAYSREVWEVMRELLNQGGMQKEYVALVEGEWSGPRTVTTFIGSPYRSGKKVRVYERDPGSKGRALPGTTQFEPLSREESATILRGAYLQGVHARVSLVRVAASPARRHQVRVHAAYCGHPLVGDTLYGAQSQLGALSKVPRDFMLHASKASFQHPVTGVPVTVEAPVEQEFNIS